MSRRSVEPDPRQRSLFDVAFLAGEGPRWLPSSGTDRGAPAAGGRGGSFDLPPADEAPACEAAPKLVGPPSPAATPTSACAPQFESTVQPPAIFRHPHGEREIRLGEHRVVYALRRARRRSIGFVVGPEGLGVSAPRWVGVREIEAALREKGPWILRKLVEQDERGRRRLAARVGWRDGTTIPFLGEPVVVVLDARAAPGHALLNGEGRALPGVARLMLHVGLAHGAAPEQIRDAVQSWLQRQARRVFEERCRLYAERLGVRWTRLSLSSAQTRWGSAHASGAIRLNWRLIHFAMSTIDYVVAHELAHLREMNHSPRFWDVVRSVLPDYEAARGALREDSLPAFD
jgi:predicted metal-dependent hydrolase